MHWILLCVLISTVYCSIIEENGEKRNIRKSSEEDSTVHNILHEIQEVRNVRKSSEEDSRVDDILHELQGICLPENHYKSAKDIKKDTQTIVNNMAVYKDIIKLTGQLKNDLKWILRESHGEKQVDRLPGLLKLDVKETCVEKITKDCTELKKWKVQSGVYKIQIGKSEVKVFCDMTTDGGGWTVIQRRSDGSENFDRLWKDYENGFGNKNGEYWLGNKNIHSLTSSEKYELRIDLTDLSNNKKYAVYKTFIVGDAASKYKLTVGDYSGNAGNNMVKHNGKVFSTKDKDSDRSGRNCLKNCGPWWNTVCCYSALNRSFGKGLHWSHFSGHKAKASVMMIRTL
ncbi:fibrinogen-like protein A isoform X1 [Mytilus galloprovincialis]|uniref:fibrinogen-like protein A isoform X1 n=1 Tax=Mytilus galloprovincialis TaxID=29158 RepID=UPI003F7C7302